LRQFLGGVFTIAFSPDGKTLVSITYAGIILWDIEKRELIGQTLTGHKEAVFSVAFSPDGKHWLRAVLTTPSSFGMWNNTIKSVSH
jgi:WD40 repeat protein